MSAPGPLLAVEGLVRRFGGVAALDGASFSVGAGERVALVGPNGAGKTTVLNCISGDERPDAGRVVLAGRDLAGLGPAPRVALGVSRSLQGLGLVEGLDVTANLLLGRHHLMRSGLVAGALRLRSARAEESAHRERCQQVARTLGLEPRAPVRSLDAGARKRLELGRVLAGDAVLLLLDEPFAGAGPGDVELMVAAIEAATGPGRAAAVVVDHALGTVSALADRLVTLDGGRTGLQGSELAR